ncbi:MAG: hypothetical protein IKX24_04310 [Prevotella sp.]|nr:hypothetical protein [Prevotella sp.]
MKKLLLMMAVVMGSTLTAVVQTKAKPTIVVNPTSLAFETTIGTPISMTVNVKGSGLNKTITATLVNSNGTTVFSTDVTTISPTDYSDGGKDVTITFSPTVAGDYTGTLTLSAKSANDVVIQLTGKAYNYFPVVITSAGLTTLYLDDPVKIPYDVYEPNILGAFYIYERDGKELKAARLEKNIPGGTGVIIEGNSGTYKFPIIDEADPLPAGAPNSLLDGCVENTPVASLLAQTPGIIYTLGRSKESYINFFKYTGTTLNANKAYYLLPEGSNAKSLTISFDGEATGIRNADTDVVDGAWYTIEGVQVQGKPMRKGLYIHNGKTVIVK